MSTGIEAAGWAASRPALALLLVALLLLPLAPPRGGVPAEAQAGYRYYTISSIDWGPLEAELGGSLASVTYGWEEEGYHYLIVILRTDAGSIVRLLRVEPEAGGAEWLFNLSVDGVLLSNPVPLRCLGFTGEEYERAYASIGVGLDGGVYVYLINASARGLSVLLASSFYDAPAGGVPSASPAAAGEGFAVTAVYWAWEGESRRAYLVTALPGGDPLGGWGIEAKPLPIRWTLGLDGAYDVLEWLGRVYWVEYTSWERIVAAVQPGFMGGGASVYAAIPGEGNVTLLHATFNLDGGLVREEAFVYEGVHWARLYPGKAHALPGDCLAGSFIAFLGFNGATVRYMAALTPLGVKVSAAVDVEFTYASAAAAPNGLVVALIDREYLLDQAGALHGLPGIGIWGRYTHAIYPLPGGRAVYIAMDLDSMQSYTYLLTVEETEEVNATQPGKAPPPQPPPEPPPPEATETTTTPPTTTATTTTAAATTVTAPPATTETTAATTTTTPPAGATRPPQATATTPGAGAAATATTTTAAVGEAAGGGPVRVGDWARYRATIRVAGHEGWVEFTVRVVEVGADGFKVVIEDVETGGAFEQAGAGGEVAEGAEYTVSLGQGPACDVPGFALLFFWANPATLPDDGVLRGESGGVRYECRFDPETGWLISRTSTYEFMGYQQEFHMELVDSNIAAGGAAGGALGGLLLAAVLAGVVAAVAVAAFLLFRRRR